MPTSSAQQYDLIVFGATSFVGKILTAYLLERHGADGTGSPDKLSWAIAARSQSKLNQLKQDLGSAGDALPTIIADADDEAAMRILAAQARVIVSTVGPYALFGSLLVKVCAETGTDYCDLTGEVQWIRRMISAYEETAKKTGARIVHCCGFDSIPSDIGVHVAQQAAQDKFGKPVTQIRMRVKAIRGGMSGGTVASLMNVLAETKTHPELRKQLQNPYLLCDGSNDTRQPNVQFAEQDEASSAWAAPFVMAAINTRVVHRSNALTGHAYGQGFKYDESMLTGKGIKGRLAAMSTAIGLGGFMVAGAITPTRKLLEKFVVPKPGEGPTPEQQRKGFFDIRMNGTTETGETVRLKVTGDRDPGYGSTGKMLGEAAVCLAKDTAKTVNEGGFWTPATAMGDALVERLTEHAGLSFEVLD